MLRHLLLFLWLLTVAAGSAYATWILISRHRYVILSLAEFLLVYASAIAWGSLIPGIFIAGRRLARSIFED